MVDHADYILAVWNGCPSGTGNTVRYAHKKGKSIIVINPVSLCLLYTSRIEGNTVTQNGEPLFKIHRRHATRKTQGCYREPVSYTHLDVYKRQDCLCEAGLGRCRSAHEADAEARKKILMRI